MESAGQDSVAPLPDDLSPEYLRGLDLWQLADLANEIRTFLVHQVSRRGGHLGPNLGVVELTLVLHRVFDSPHDPIVFDTGHQAYVHKIVTGRAGDFDTLRTRGGLSGYPSRAESEHDWVENSHASTSLSYADGLAKAFATPRRHHRTVVAVIGDGALTGGMAWEALNNIAAARDRPLVIVLNDNGRSYAPTTGGMARADGRPAPPARLRADVGAGQAHAAAGAGGRPAAVLDAACDQDGGAKDWLVPQSMFEDLGLKYVGPIDGHDLAALERALTSARKLRWAHPGALPDAEGPRLPARRAGRRRADALTSGVRPADRAAAQPEQPPGRRLRPGDGARRVRSDRTWWR